MSKVICEICGTTYPDTENECPVCGFEKPETAEFEPEDVSSAAAVASTPVKGGRFSKANVSKKAAATAAAAPARKKKNKKQGGSDTGLIIAIIVLLLAIIATAGYIYIRYFAPQKAPEATNPPVQTTTEPSKETLPPQTQDTTEAPDLSCTGLHLREGDKILLNQIGSRWILNVVPEPANTTDEITYVSADESIATVSATGEVTPVSNGETVIIITCGEISIQCQVICQLPDGTEPEKTEPEKTEPEETEPEETEPEETQPKDDFKFNSKYGNEVTMNVGETWTAYVGDIPVEDIQWSVGNTSVATVNNGRVRAVGAGWTTLRAVYNGVEYKCTIYVNA